MFVGTQDGGDPAVEASPRDIMYRLPAEEAEAGPSAQPHVLAQTDLRWGACCVGCHNCIGGPMAGASCAPDGPPSL